MLFRSLTVSGAIVIRSYVIRRRQREAIERAIRDGTYIPPSPGSGGFPGFNGLNGIGGLNGMGGWPGRRGRKRVDLGRKPGIWDVYLGGGLGAGAGGNGDGDVKENENVNVKEKEKEVDWWGGVMVRLFLSLLFS